MLNTDAQNFRGLDAMATATQNAPNAVDKAVRLLREAIQLAAAGLHTADDLHEALDEAEVILGIPHTSRT